MKTSINGINLIIKYEGFKSKPYLCPAGIATIGYGSTKYEDGTKVTLEDPEITPEQGIELLKRTLDIYEGCVKIYTREVDINQNQFDALVSFVYNIGCFNFGQSTLVKKLKNDPNDKTISAQFARWNKGGGKVLKGLVKRRAEEAKLYFK